MPNNSISTPGFPSIQLDYPMPTLKQDDESEGPLEIAICGDLSEHESDIWREKLLAVSPGGQCTLYFQFLRAGVLMRRLSCWLR